MYDRIVAKLETSSQILGAGVTVINTTGGEDLLIPKTTTNAAGALVAEGAGYAEADAVFAQVVLGAFKYGNLIQVSEELIADSAFDIAGFLADTGGAGIGRAFAADVAAGSGSSRPKGIANACTSFGTSASATTITAANVFEIWGTMGTQYRTPETKFIMSPGAEKLIRLLVDSNGQYIWSPGLVAGTPANLIGYEVVTDSNIDAPTSGKRALLFAHMPSFFVRMAGGVEVATSSDYAFNAGLVTYRFTMRADCDGVDDNGLGCLTQAYTTRGRSGLFGGSASSSIQGEPYENQDTRINSVDCRRRLRPWRNRRLARRERSETAHQVRRRRTSSSNKEESQRDRLGQRNHRDRLTRLGEYRGLLRHSII